MKAEEIQKIDEYIQGEITYAELSAYAQSQGMEDLDDKIAWVRNASIAIEADGVRQQIKNMLAETVKADKPKTEARVISMKPKRWIIGIAASAMVIVSAYFFFFNEGGFDHQYASYEYVDPGLPVVMSQSDNYALYDALSYFGEENYKVAIDKLSSIQQDGADTDTVSFYLGASQLYTGNALSAQSELQKVLDTPDSKFTEKAEWLLVICSLKNKNVPLAKSQLKNIVSQPNHTFHQRAIALMKELEQK